MLEPKIFFNYLKEENINFFTGIPDSLLKNICYYISENALPRNHIIAANEGNALSLGIGYHIATNKIPLIYMQNSGMGNIINPLLSLAAPSIYSIPLLLMIGWRGQPGTKDEPQHIEQGEVTLELLKIMKIPYLILSPSTTNQEAKNIVKKSIFYASKKNSPYALVICKGTFARYNLERKIYNNFILSREEAIALILHELNDKDIIVSTTGVASRELFEYREKNNQDHKKDFLTIGGMGHANQIAMGIALQKNNKTIFCLDGDGAILMHMGSLAINATIQCSNFKHIILNNGCHDSVGGQPTAARNIDITSVAKAVGYKQVFQAKSRHELTEKIRKLKESSKMALLEVKLKEGFRKDLKRPTRPPLSNKKEFMEFIN